MKLDFATKVLFVVDLWLAMSIITSILLETTLLQNTNGLISISVFAGAISINILAAAMILAARKAIKIDKFEK